MPELLNKLPALCSYRHWNCQTLTWRTLLPAGSWLQDILFSPRSSQIRLSVSVCQWFWDSNQGCNSSAVPHDFRLCGQTARLAAQGCFYAICPAENGWGPELPFAGVSGEVRGGSWPLRAQLGLDLLMEVACLVKNPASHTFSWGKWTGSRDAQLGEVINTEQAFREIGWVFLDGVSCGLFACVHVLELEQREFLWWWSLLNCSKWIYLDCLNCS